MTERKPLSPAELARAAEAYAKTGNYSEAARAIGRDEAPVRRALKRVLNSDRQTLRRDSIAEGVEKGVKALSKTLNVVTERLDGDLSKLSFTDLLNLTRSLSLTTSRFVELAELEMKQRQAVLTRNKTRAEIRAIEKLRGGGATTIVELLELLRSTSSEDLRAALEQLRSERTSPGN